MYMHLKAVQGFSIALILISGTGPAWSQSPPDAGALRRQIEQQRQPPLPPKAAPQFEAPPPLEDTGGATVTVTAFDFSGNTLLSKNKLARSVAGFVGRPLSFAELQNAAIAVADAYRRAGWVVRAYLPKQDITGGAVTIQIIEAKLGEVRVNGESKRISPDQAKHIVERAQRVGRPLNADALDRALLLIGDMPGVHAAGSLAEGIHQSETDLVVALADGNEVSGDVSADNAGQRATGAARIVADATLNSPFGFGDRAAATILHSSGSDYQRAAYSVPVGSAGWRVGLNGSHLAYSIISAAFAALDAHGNSSTVGLEGTYPLLRSRLKNLYFSANLDDKRFDNLSGGATTSRYSSQELSLGLYGNLFDNLGAGSANNASVTVTQGHLDLAGSPNEGADAATTGTAGSFRKVQFSASRLQSITDRFSLYAALSGQTASKNLDSSEKFYLGGSTGVRAYPADEAGGAEGLLFGFEARERLPRNFSLTGFVDYGSVRINKRSAFAGAQRPNDESLKGAGVSLGWFADFGLSAKATYAHRIGSNPSPTSTGNDQDGSLIKNRIWLQLSMPF
jgi:hemolysin activation/secretion protein